MQPIDPVLKSPSGLLHIDMQQLYLAAYILAAQSFMNI